MTADLSILSLLSMYALMLLPLAVLFYLQLGVVRETLIGMVRMTIQLILVGLYLKYIFQLNNPFVSLLWVAVMLVVANLSILSKAGLKRGPFFWRSLTGVAGSTLFVSGWFNFRFFKYFAFASKSGYHWQYTIYRPKRLHSDTI